VRQQRTQLHAAGMAVGCQLGTCASLLAITQSASSVERDCGMGAGPSPRKRLQSITVAHTGLMGRASRGPHVSDGISIADGVVEVQRYPRELTEAQQHGCQHW
jgi:hypothetical protein